MISIFCFDLFELNGNRNKNKNTKKTKQKQIMQGGDRFKIGNSSVGERLPT